MPIWTKKSGVWRPVVDVSAKVSGSWKSVNKAFTKVSGSWKPMYIRPYLIQNAIVPLLDASVPTGFTEYTGAANKMVRIVTGSPGGTGGSFTGTYSLPASASHTGNDDWFALFATGTPHASSAGNTDVAAGSSVHSRTTGSMYPNLHRIHLIKADADIFVIPANVAVFGDPTIWENNWGLTRLIQSSADRWPMAINIPGSVGDQDGVYEDLGNSDYDGSHEHTNTSFISAGTGGVKYNHSAGNHRHSINIVVSWDLYYTIARTWYDSSSEFSMRRGMMALWVEASPPAAGSGWFIADGNNGTEDMGNGRFLRYGESGEDHADTGGTNNNTAAGNSDYAGDHDHDDGNWVGITYGGQKHHTNSTGSHRHVVSDDAPLPPYMNFNVIQFTGEVG